MTISMNNPSQYIENILLEILDRPCFWLEREDSHKYNIERFNAQKAALDFLEQYKGRNLVKAQKINLSFNNERLHLVVLYLKYRNIEDNLKITPNTTVEFIYRRILFCHIKWPKIIINNSKQSSSMNKNQSKTTPELLNQKNKTVSSLSPIIHHSDSQEYQSINNLPNMVTDESLILEHTNNEEKHFRSTIFIHFNQNGLNNS